MSHAAYHAQSSANAFGGVMEDYLAIHEWFDRSRGGTSSILHRMLAHHTVDWYHRRRAWRRTLPLRSLVRPQQAQG